MDERDGAKGLVRFEPHAWDKRQRDRPTGEYKALVCGIALLGAAHGTPFEILEVWIRANLERQWTVVNATQYLAGGEAEPAFSKLPKDFDFLGITPAALLPACAVARDVVSGPMATAEVLRRLRQEAPRLGDAAALADVIVRRFAADLIGRVEGGVRLPATMGIRPSDIDRVAVLLRSS